MIFNVVTSPNKWWRRASLLGYTNDPIASGVKEKWEVDRDLRLWDLKRRDEGTTRKRRWKVEGLTKREKNWRSKLRLSGEEVLLPNRCVIFGLLLKASYQLKMYFLTYKPMITFPKFANVGLPPNNPSVEQSTL